jgi:hypothetical protein
MTCQTNPTGSGNSWFTVGSFTVYDNFVFAMSPPIESAEEVRSANGDLHVYSSFWKDSFDVTFNRVTQDDYNSLMQALQAVGADALHFAEYGSPELTRRWDADSTSSGTAPGYGVNVDVNRVRRKARLRRISAPHATGIANEYVVSLSFEEG